MKLKIIKLPFREYGIFFIFLIICAVLSILTGGIFLRPENLINVARQISMESIIAVGMPMVIITAGIDLSVGSVAALSAVLGCNVLTLDLGLPIYVMIFLSLLCGILAGALCGSFNGLMVTIFRVPPFVVTLAVMVMARGLAYIFCKGLPVFNLPTEFTSLGRGYVIEGLLPVPVLIMAVILIVSHIMLTRTKFGRYIYAIGGNEEVSRLSGINVRKYKFLVYLITGVLSALAGMILASRLGSGDPKSADGWELNVIAAVVVGGTSLMGGKGSIMGTFVGALVIGVLNNGLNLMNVEAYWQKVFLGAVILAAVLLDQLRKKD